MSFDSLEDIDSKFYISYRDKDNFNYGFDIRSINYMMENKLDLHNPYNRNCFPDNFLKNCRVLIDDIKRKKYRFELEWGRRTRKNTGGSI